MITLVAVIHIIVCFFLIVIVLLQHGKGADMGATFGGGSSQTLFGTEGPLPLLNKITTTAAVVFMITSLGLAYMSANTGKGSVMQSVQPPPAAPVAPLEGELQRSPSTIPLPDTEGTETPTEAAPQEFPGEKAVEEQAPATFPGSDQPANSEPAEKQQ